MSQVALITGGGGGIGGATNGAGRCGGVVANYGKGRFRAYQESKSPSIPLFSKGGLSLPPPSRLLNKL